jgi:hypothetical protein
VGERLGSVMGALQMLVDDSFLVVLGHGELEEVQTGRRCKSAMARERAKRKTDIAFKGVLTE